MLPLNSILLEGVCAIKANSYFILITKTSATTAMRIKVVMGEGKSMPDSLTIHKSVRVVGKLNVDVDGIFLICEHLDLKHGEQALEMLEEEVEEFEF